MRDLRCAHCKAPTQSITAHFRCDGKDWALPVEVCTSTGCLQRAGGSFTVPHKAASKGVQDAVSMSNAPVGVGQ